MNLFDMDGAIFSDDRKYRYVLWRTWDAYKPAVQFIGLNPSTADETNPDPTITRVIGFARDWGFGSLYMTNLFAIISSKPGILKSHPNPLGDNNNWLTGASLKCDQIIFCWGRFKEARERAKEVIEMFPNAFCLKKNKDGSPIHPLYVRGDTKLIKF